MSGFLRRLREQRPPGALDAWFARELDDEAAWVDLRPGPHIDAVASRISSIPQEFLDDRLDVRALLGDLTGRPVPITPDLELLTATSERRRACAVAVWLWASETVVEPFHPTLGEPGRPQVLLALALRLAPLVPVETWLVDAERREEAARLVLLWAGLLPAGEDVPTARARWERLDTAAHDAAMRDALAEHARRLEVQRALRAKAAAEAAARYQHE